MPEKSDIEEPPETIYSLKHQINNFFNKLFNRPKALPVEANLIQPNIIIQNFESFAEKIVEDIMIPRSDIIAVSCEASLEDMAQRNGTCKKRNHWLVSLILTILQRNKFSDAPSFSLIYLFLCNLNNLQR